ncbi:two-component system response regulator [Candidatus Roizmanbacteria bacterium CG_4_9_14_0_2_um_filter_39_13]|uniref:Two-component system response regulator n=1 Tax=Candidatus Roizmanbacteria bacterium CG_4_9_14_0_2_um_filter_39_13 TaxID=1974839 RepID=A0A2M8F1Z1_9BACT|nr:MAG: two-component system response regulator [Candidatus Roizmanbacteria bacterium CG_4_10_14_0_2_um_filter_39_12]PJC33305.1 MAG: two-component system response regulator [Candidatus Roizmanbacteria bacterium CG_4_9_14_0_2_um_filter_39_13]
MNILIAEDDEFFQKFYKNQLEQHGYTVQIASNGVEAMTQIAIQKPDLLILDIIMPEKDGFEVLEDLSASGQINTIPVLIFSTLGQEKDMNHALELGAKGYVNKSFFDFDTLLVKIKEVTGL